MWSSGLPGLTLFRKWAGLPVGKGGLEFMGLGVCLF